MQPSKQFMDSEPKIQQVDLQVEEVLNDSLNSLEGIIYHYYMDINKQYKDDDF